MIIILTILGYFAILLTVSRVTGGKTDNDTFYRGNRHSPWYMVAFGMIGASISGITFVSVPGMVLKTDMTYMQTCLGFILGYFAVAFILLPIYYKNNLTTIYSYLERRLGSKSYKTGAYFFLLSKMTGASARFYVVCFILHNFVFDAIGVPFIVTAAGMILLIWLYTRKGGIKTLVWTDAFQTLCMFVAVVLIIYNVMDSLGMDASETVKAIASDSHSRMFVFDDIMSRQYFWKQFISGIFIVIVMTGLDQDMMQKNLTCKSLADARKDMCTYGFAFVPANLLFLSLGLLLVILSGRMGIELPAKGDDLLPLFAASGTFGNSVLMLFTIGIVAASFSSADSALTSMTTCFCVDICRRKNDEALRKRTHIVMGVVFLLFVLLFRAVNSQSVIDAIYTLCGYTYGPLLGLFAFAIIGKLKANDKAVPFIAIASPIVCFIADWLTSHYTSYRFGYELLMLNGLLTFIGLWISSIKSDKQENAKQLS